MKDTLIGGVEGALLGLDIASWQGLLTQYLTGPPPNH